MSPEEIEAIAAAIIKREHSFLRFMKSWGTMFLVIVGFAVQWGVVSGRIEDDRIDLKAHLENFGAHPSALSVQKHLDAEHLHATDEHIQVLIHEETREFAKDIAEIKAGIQVNQVTLENVRADVSELKVNMDASITK